VLKQETPVTVFFFRLSKNRISRYHRNDSEFLPHYTVLGGYAMAHLVETLHYKPEGRRVDSR
jgi:predicted cupin superfamily sugar epimerase